MKKMILTLLACLFALSLTGCKSYVVDDNGVRHEMTENSETVAVAVDSICSYTWHTGDAELHFGLVGGGDLDGKLKKIQDAAVKKLALIQDPYLHKARIGVAVEVINQCNQALAEATGMHGEALQAFYLSERYQKLQVADQRALARAEREMYVANKP